MRGVKQADTKPERIVRKMLHAMGLRFRLHRKDLPGRPDIVLPRHGVVIMVQRCFWHQHEDCREGRVPASNVEYWKPKLARNVERDKENAAELEALGWRVLTVWECQSRDVTVLGEMLSRWFPRQLSPIASGMGVIV